jgi:hypothetical protein
MSEKKIPNPNGRNGKPIEVPPMDFDDALRKILGAGKPSAPKETNPSKARKNKNRR